MDPVLLTSKSNEWGTPQWLFDELNLFFHFTLDPCATDQNHKCMKYYTIEDNGLEKSWKGETVFCNPPYGRDIRKWVKKAYEESRDLETIVVLLIPARTDTSYFHDYIYKKDGVDIHFLRGRLKFTNQYGEETDPAPFPSMIVVMK